MAMTGRLTCRTATTPHPAPARGQPLAANPGGQAAADHDRRNGRLGAIEGRDRPRSNGFEAQVSAARRLPRLLLVTGMSGAGKSTVLDALEDMGWDIVDNLPADLLKDFVHGGGQCRTANVAVGMDVRSRGFDPAALAHLIRSIEGVDPELLY